jgi:hypothetical protein
MKVIVNHNVLKIFYLPKNQALLIAFIQNNKTYTIKIYNLSQYTVFINIYCN